MRRYRTGAKGAATSIRVMMTTAFGIDYHGDNVLLATKSKKQIFSLEKASQQLEIIRNAYPPEFAFKQIMIIHVYGIHI